MRQAARVLREQGRKSPMQRAKPGRHHELRRQRPVWQGLTPTPDRGFVRKLREFDPDLSVEFDRGLGRFVIYQQGRISGKTVAMVIRGGEDTECGFRQPDERDLCLLRQVDMHNERTRRRLIEGREKELVEGSRKEMVDAQTEFHEASLDDKHQIKRAYRIMMNDGKAPSHVPPVRPKPKGKVFK